MLGITPHDSAVHGRDGFVAPETVVHAADATGHLLCAVLDIPGQPARIDRQARSLVLEYGARDLEVAPQPETDTFLLTVRTGPSLAYDISTWTDAGHL